MATVVIAVVMVVKFCRKRCICKGGRWKKRFSKFRGGQAHLEYRGTRSDLSNPENINTECLPSQLAIRRSEQIPPPQPPTSAAITLNPSNPPPQKQQQCPPPPPTIIPTPAPPSSPPPRRTPSRQIPTPPTPLPLPPPPPIPPPPPAQQIDRDSTPISTPNSRS